MVIKEHPEAPPESARCWATSEVEADVATVAGYAAQRWDIETWSGDYSSGAIGSIDYWVCRAHRFNHRSAVSMDREGAPALAESSPPWNRCCAWAELFRQAVMPL